MSSCIRLSWKYLIEFNTELEHLDRALERIDARLVGPERLTNSQFQQLIQERNNLQARRAILRSKIARAQQSRNPWGERIEIAVV